MYAKFSSVVVVTAFFFVSQSALAKETSSDYVLAPIYFVTDRVPQKKNGKIEKFIDYGQAVSNYSAGVRYVPVPLREDIQKSWTDLEALGWVNRDHFPSETPTVKPSNARSKAVRAAALLSNYDLNDSDVIAAVKKLPAFTGGGTASGELVLFVHGFFNSFEDSTDGAADVASYFKRPVLVYCWSTPKEQVKPNGVPIPLTGIKVPNLTPKIWQSYRESEVTYQQGQDKYAALIEALSMSFNPNKIILVAHSMGSRLLDQALVSRSGYFDTVASEKKFSAILFSNPDIDGKSFASHAEVICDQAKVVRVFFVAQDGAMQVSRFLHGAHDRLGAPNRGIFAELRKSHVSMVDMSKLDKNTLGVLGHSMPAWILANFYKYQTAEVSHEHYIESRPNGDDSLVVIDRLNSNSNSKNR